MNRRKFVTLAAAVPAATAVAATGGNTRIPVRKIGKVEIAFKSPGYQPNGLQATKEGLWIIDQGKGNQAHLVSYDGKVIRGFETETERSSGITFDGEALWIGSTYSREIVRCDAHTGKAISRYFTPGAGVIYRMVGDAAARSTPVPESLRQKRPVEPASGSAKKKSVGGFQMGQVSSTAPGTGAHGQEWRDGKLWFVVPPSREVYRVNPAEWMVEKKFPTAGNRPHGLGWEGKYLWVADSNLNAFHKHDPTTGEIVERIQLGDADPLPHGMTIWDGWMWYCDDIGLVCKFKL